MTIFNTIIEEKNARILDMLLCHVTPFEILKGKIFGHLAVVTLQILGLGLIESVLNKIIGINEGIPRMLLVLTTVIIGVGTYDYVFAALASMADYKKEAAQFTCPAVLVILVSFFLSVEVLVNSGHLWSSMLSFVPIMSPFFVISCNISEDISLYDILFNIALLAVHYLIVSKLSTKVFVRAVKV